MMSETEHNENGASDISSVGVIDISDNTIDFIQLDSFVVEIFGRSCGLLRNSAVSKSTASGDR